MYMHVVERESSPSSVVNIAASALGAISSLNCKKAGISSEDFSWCKKDALPS